MKVKSLAKFVFLKGGKKSNTITDDDTDCSDSVSSTQTVDCSSKQQASQPEEEDEHTTVRFNLKETKVHHIPCIDPEETSTRWYSEQDYISMKEATRATAKAVRGSETFMSILVPTYEACCQGVEVNQNELRQQYQLWAARTGLEYKIVKSASKGKYLRRLFLNDLVCNLSEEFPGLSQDDFRELLREKCEELSKPARLFALYIGRAQTS